MERKGEDRAVTGQVFEINYGGKEVYTRIYGKGGIAERNIKRESGYEGLEL